MVAVDDIGAFAALAFARPGDFLGKTVELSGDELTEPQIAAVFTKVIGREVKAAPPQMQGVPAPEMKPMQTFFSSRAYDADIPSLRKLYPSLHTLERGCGRLVANACQFCRGPGLQWLGVVTGAFRHEHQPGLTDRRKQSPALERGFFGLLARTGGIAGVSPHHLDAQSERARTARSKSCPASVSSYST